MAPTGAGPGACLVKWQRSGKLMTYPGQPVFVRMHRCALVGEHSSHLCPCGSMLVGGAS